VSSLTAFLGELGLDPGLESTLTSFQRLFLKWNRSINLSAARTESEILEHIVDSLHVVPRLRAATGQTGASQLRVLDVGAGGGFPSVITAICLPDASVTALEPVHKKHAFLRTAARELGLAHLDPRADRVDDHPARDYDVAVSRATFDLRDWLLLGLTRVRPDGLVLGFEAVPRLDLPPDTARTRYNLNGKHRAIVELRRSN
jgi:16S rRNA (guanine527-N7)-methyltransferase